MVRAFEKMRVWLLMLFHRQLIIEKSTKRK
jgi:hypothetical protein